MKRTALFILLCISLQISAQVKNYEKAKLLFAQGNFGGANKLIDKCLEDEETRDNPNVILLKSKIMFNIFLEKTLLEKFPSALKDALKYAEKALEANPSTSAKTTFKENNLEYFSVLVKQNNKEALESYNSKKYSKALPLFKKSMYFGLDTQSMVLAGDCYWNMGQETESTTYFKKSAEMIYAAVQDSNSRVFGYFKEPFRKLGKYYIDRQQYDSAYVIVKNGREILPSDPILTQYTYSLMRYTLDRIPPSDDYLHLVTQSLKDFPSDSFLNHRENSIYIFLLNGMAEANEQVQFDTLLNRYAASKLNKSKLKTLSLVKKYDIFAGESPEVFLEHLKHYFADVDLPEACYATCRAQVDRNWKAVAPPAGVKTDKKVPATAETTKGVIPSPASPDLAVLKMAREENRSKVAEMIFSRYLQLHPKSAEAMKERAGYTSTKNKSTLAYYDLLPMILLNDASAKDMPKDLTYKSKAKEYRLRLINETTDSGDFRLARRTWHESQKLYADQFKTLDQQWRKLVETDFRVNYFGSRINAKGKNEKGIPEYTWNGNGDSCISGSMPLNIVLRAERRINYFRRMAGVTEEIILSTQDNEYCQIAVMMCEANKTMTHEPNDGWRCFIPAGADALKNSILSKDGNPGIAVTAAMGQNHPTAGNRRWLLYPNALYMGIGTSKSYSAIKAVDNSGGIDSNKYRTNFVAWPPANHCPKMLAFKQWSFSIDQDLKGATVTMKDASGNAVNLKQDAYAPGYGMNTVVWEPEINTTLTTDAEYHVSVKLASGKIYAYKVVIMDVKI